MSTLRWLRRIRRSHVDLRDGGWFLYGFGCVVLSDVLGSSWGLRDGLREHPSLQEEESRLWGCCSQFLGPPGGLSCRTPWGNSCYKLTQRGVGLAAGQLYADQAEGFTAFSSFMAPQRTYHLAGDGGVARDFRGGTGRPYSQGVAEDMVQYRLCLDDGEDERLGSEAFRKIIPKSQASHSGIDGAARGRCNVLHFLRGRPDLVEEVRNKVDILFGQDGGRARRGGGLGRHGGCR